MGPLINALSQSNVPVIYETAYSGIEVTSPPFPTTNRYVREGGTTRLLANHGTAALNDGNELFDFLTMATTTLPAARYALVIHGHYGGPPHALGVDTNPPGLELTLTTLDQTLLRARSSMNQQKFELIVLDVPEGATIEVAAVLAKHANFLLAFEGSAPSPGFDVAGLLQTMTTMPSSDGRAVVSAALLNLPAYLVAASPTEVPESVAVAIDLSRVAPVLSSMDALAKALSPKLTSMPVCTRIGAARRDARRFDVALKTGIMDLTAFATNLSSAAATIGSDAAAAAAALESAAASSVLAKYSGSAMTGASGIGVYFPQNAAQFDNAYLSEAASIPSSWTLFLASYEQATTGTGATPTVTIGVTPAIVGGQAFSVVGTVSPATAIEDVTLVVSQPLGTENAIVFRVPLGPPDAGGNVSWTGSASFVSLSDAAMSASAIFVPLGRQTSGTEVYEIEADVLYSGSAFRYGVLRVSSAPTGVTTTAWTSVDSGSSSLAVGDLLSAMPLGRIFPRVVSISADGSITSVSETTLGYSLGSSVTSLKVNAATKPNTGPTTVWLVAETFAGSRGVASASVTIQ